MAIPTSVVSCRLKLVLFKNSLTMLAPSAAKSNGDTRSPMPGRPASLLRKRQVKMFYLLIVEIQANMIGRTYIDSRKHRA